MQQKEIESYISAGETQKALTALDQLLDETAHHTDPATEAWGYRKKAQCHFMRSESAEAVSCATTGLEAAYRSGDRLEAAEAENTTGVIYGETGELEEAVKHLERSYQLHREVDSPRMAAVLNNIGNTCLIMDDAERALPYFRQAVAAAEAHGEQEAIAATALGNIGRALRGLGRASEALDPLRESISRFERAGMDSFRLHGLVKLAAALEDMGELAEAEAIYRGVLEDAGDREEAAWLSEVHGTLAGLLHRQGRWEEAREVFHAALTGTVEVERDRDRPYWRRRLADIQSSEGELPEAIETLKAAFDELDRVAQERTEEQVHQALGRLELQRIEHEKEVYRLKNEELGNALAEVESLRGELETRNAELSELVVRDALTGVYNRRWFMSRIATEIDRAARYERPLTIALVDIDLFKSVNDDFGHSAGDAVLVGVSEILNRSTRGSDEVARYGGEEFAVIMPETDGEQGRIVCEKLRRSVQEADWSGAGVPRRVTISCGVAQLRPEDTATSLVDRSDRALYRGKESGRNRVIAES